MKAKVVGIQRGIDFTAEDGRRITGTSIHANYIDDKVDGIAVKKIFVNADISTAHVTPGCDYDFVYECGFGGRARLVRIDEAD